MDNLCRLCLKVSYKNMCKLQECELLSKLRTFLSIQISTDDSFPNKLCKECIKKISEINEFCITIKENEEKLQQCLISGSLQDYYLKLNNNFHIKEEQDECIIFCESKYVKIEESNIKTVSEIDTNINKKQDNTNINKDENNFDENFKHEEIADNNLQCSSDDEITLSSIKKEKELHTSTLIKNNKKIKQNNPKKRNINKPQHTTDVNTDYVKQFTCLTCLKPCESQAVLIRHYHDEHLRQYRNTNKKYTKHESDGNVSYKCESCEKTCTSKKDIVKHVASHNDERPLICKLCGRMYKTVTEIIRHTRVHNGFKLQCSHNCGYTTAYQGALKEHEKRHLDVYKYTCEKCGKGFFVKTWYEQHQNVHTGLKPFVCDICGLAFHMARYLTAHRSLIHPQSSAVKRYICVLCNQKCDCANSLALHLEEHGINKEKEFLCDFCGKILSSADQLKYHHRMHSGVKPYSCSICNKSFAKKFNVKVHMSSHSGEKTHCCARCGKRYTQRSTLLRHLKRHHTSTSPKQAIAETV